MKNAIILCSMFCVSMLSANVVNVNPGSGTYQVDKYGSKVNTKTMTPTKNELNGDDHPKFKSDHSRPIREDVNMRKIKKW